MQIARDLNVANLLQKLQDKTQELYDHMLQRSTAKDEIVVGGIV